MTDLTTTTQLDRLRAALPGGTVPPDLIEPLSDLIHQLDFATGAAGHAIKRYPDAADVAKRSAYREAGLDVVLVLQRQMYGRPSLTCDDVSSASLRPGVSPGSSAVVLDAFARLRDGAPLPGTEG